ncbi:MAG: tcyK [Firmicutes bacterium]|nr:tcyK [Bacillota bacterium]
MRKASKVKKIILLFGALLLLALAVAGCGSASEETKGSASEPKKIVIGTGNGFKPYCYLDDQGKLAGYELEVLQEVNKRLPQYKFEFETMEFKNVLLSLGTGKVDIGAHQFEKNPDREQKYLFSDESYTTFILRIIVAKNRNDINSIEDLHGKTVEVGEGSNDAYVLEKYNKEHGNPIKLVYTSGVDPVTIIKNIEDRRTDAFISIKRVVDSYNKAYGDKLKTVGTPIATSSTYYLYRKEDTQLKADIDKVLKEMKADGTLAKISIKVLGGDYTSND